MKKFILVVLAFSAFASRVQASTPEKNNHGEEPATTILKPVELNTDVVSKKGNKNKPVIIEFFSDYNLMVYPEDLEGVYTWDEGVKACEELVAFGFDDWYLPSQDELIAVYEKRKKIGNFTKATYWSSTEAYTPGGNLAYFHSFWNNTLAYYPKELKRLVRCVRKVSEK